MSAPPSRRQLAAARTLAVDAVTAEVLGAFEAARCRSIVLKGPTLQIELHDDGSRRGYVDTDLLVSPADLAKAGDALDGLGFAMVMDDRDHPGIVEPHAQHWLRAPKRKVDLHWRIPGVDAAPERAWGVLSAETMAVTVGGVTGESLARPGIALLVALHVSHHGTTFRRALNDLDRALDRFDAETWAAAARLAVQLDAEEAFAAGLRLAPAGERLATDLGLPAVLSARRRLIAGAQPPGSLGVMRVVEAPTARARARAAREELFPGPAFMRRVSALARRGPAGLALAYAARVGERAWQLPRAIRAVRQSRRPPE